MAESSTTTQSSNFPSGTGKHFLQAPEKVGKAVHPQESRNGRSDNQTAASLVSTKPPRRKKSLMESLRKSFSEFRYGPKSEGSENDKKSQQERYDNKESEVREAEIEGTGVLGRSSEGNKVDSCSSLPDAVKKFLSSHATSLGIKRGQDYIFDVNRFGNEVDKIGLSLFDIVRHSKLQAVTLQRKLEEDWGLELGRRDSGDLFRSPSMKRQHEKNNQDNTGLDNNLNNCPDTGGILGLKCSITVPETPGNGTPGNGTPRNGTPGNGTPGNGTPSNGSSSETPNPSLKSPQPRHGVYIIGLAEGGVANRCGELAVEDLIIEVNSIMTLNCSAETVTAAMEQITTVNLVVARKRDA